MSLELKKRPSKKAVIIAGVVTLIGIASISSAAQNNNSLQNSSPSAPTTTQQVKDAQTQKAPTIETKAITETESIPYNKTTQNDATLESGKTSLATVGVDGEKIITYEVTLSDGQETSRKKTSEQITKQPVDEVTKIGTKVAGAPAPPCPNGTYVNSVGNIVCSPYASSSVPAGASAECSDGTYSFSQSRRGTCSHHGGVAIWY